MSKPLKPLRFHDLLLTGKAVDGFADLRIMDGEKLASRRLNIAELLELRIWLVNFIGEYKYRNRGIANIERIPQNQNKRLSIGEIESIRVRLDNGENVNKIADELGLSASTIHRIDRE